MSRYESESEGLDRDELSVCAKILKYTWKTITFLFSHVALVATVVAYCILGAMSFKALEQDHELEVKRNISNLRHNVSMQLWNLTLELEYLRKENFTQGAVAHLTFFETELLRAMTKLGWDGDENIENKQWTTTGALFYSIVVITTIGYGHITPKTSYGKVATMFYAILGIPLMLLCLSNIGDIMATSFRFLYWRVCCYFCTKKPKKKRARSTRSIHRATDGRFVKTRNTSFRRSMRTSTRSADSGFGFSEIGPTSHSDTELRYHDNVSDAPRGSSMPRLKSGNHSRTTEYAAPRRKISPIVVNKPPNNPRGGSLDRRKQDTVIELDPIILAKTPILCNKYVVGKNDLLSNNIPGITTRNMEGQGRTSPLPERRAQSMPRSRYLEPPRFPSPNLTDTEEEVESVRSKRSRKRSPARISSSPKMMTPLGYGHRSKYLDDSESEDEYYDDVYYESRARIKPVPIWLCVFLVVSYILAGAFLFNYWERWDLLESAYFCFITLTTIGFGDYVPLNAKGVGKDMRLEKKNKEISIALCSLYLLFGISLLAMSFNLVQEEVIAHVKRVAKKLGIIKKNFDDDSEEDD